MVELCDGAWLDGVGHLECGIERYILSTLSCYCSPRCHHHGLLSGVLRLRKNKSFHFWIFSPAACKSYVKLTDTSWKDIVGPTVARPVLQPRRPTLCQLSFTTKQTIAFKDHCFCVIQVCTELKSRPTGCLQRDVCCWLQHFHSIVSQSS